MKGLDQGNTVERFVLSLSKIHPSASDVQCAIQMSARPEFSWDAVCDLAEQHRVLALIANNLQGNEAWRDIPAHNRTRLGQALVYLKARNKVLIKFLQVPLSKFSKENIPYALLKGGAMEAMYYPPGTHYLNDVDLLIQKEHYPKVSSILSELGFQRVEENESQVLEVYHEIGFRKRTVGDLLLYIDLHWLIYPETRSYHMPVKNILDRSQQSSLGDQGVWVTSPEDTLIHLATQVVNDRFKVWFGRILDIHTLVSSGQDWERLVDQAKKAHAAGVTYVALSLAGSLGAEVPAHVMGKLRRGNRGCKTVASILRDPGFLLGRKELRSTVMVMILPLLYDCFPHRMAYLYRIIFPITKPDVMTIHEVTRDWGTKGMPGPYLFRRLVVIGQLFLATIAIFGVWFCNILGFQGNLAKRLRESVWRPAAGDKAECFQAK